MNPFVNPEFWLSLAFIVVLFMVVFRPVRHAICKTFLHQKEEIQNKITESNDIYKEAKDLHKKALEEFNKPIKNPEIKTQASLIQKEFSEKELLQINSKKQNFQINKTLLLAQAKIHLRKQLLDMTEKEIFAQKYTQSNLTQDIDNLIKKLEQNKDFINQNL